MHPESDLHLEVSNGFVGALGCVWARNPTAKKPRAWLEQVAMPKSYAQSKGPEKPQESQTRQRGFNGTPGFRVSGAPPPPNPVFGRAPVPEGSGEISKGGDLGGGVFPGFSGLEGESLFVFSKNRVATCKDFYVNEARLK